MVGTGKVNSVREFAKKAFEVVDLKYEKFTKINKKLLRPAEVELLCADVTKINKRLKWKPKVTFEELVEKMVKNDYDLLKKNI